MARSLDSLWDHPEGRGYPREEELEEIDEGEAGVEES